jgi:Ca2+-transporting ATPase
MLVQLFVLFEIFHIGNARSETTSLFRLSPLANPLLLAGTGLALTTHLVAIHTPLFQRLLGFQPVSLQEWAVLAALALSIVIVMEGHKMGRKVGK